MDEEDVVVIECSECHREIVRLTIRPSAAERRTLEEAPMKESNR
jgi:hypothetical protein